MKRFVWRLQRLLDIKIKQEDSIRAELVSVTEQAVAVRGRIMVARTQLRRLLGELGQKDAAAKIHDQRLFMEYSQVSEQNIRNMQAELAKLEQLRKQKIEELMKIRRFRKGLEKLREKARAEYLEAERKLEQGDLDDRTSISYARKIMQG